MRSLGGLRHAFEHTDARALGYLSRSKAINLDKAHRTFPESDTRSSRA
jgi:hypothetical protein